MGSGMAGIQGQGFPVFADGFVHPPLTGQYRPQIIECIRIFWIAPDGLAVMSFRPFPVPFQEKRMGQIAACNGIPSGYGKGVFKKHAAVLPVLELMPCPIGGSRNNNNHD